MMLKKNGFELENLDTLLKKLNSMSLKVDKSVEEKAVKAGAEEAKDKIENHPNFPRSNLPKEHAQDNVIVVEKHDNEYQVGVHKDHFYVQFHEFGAEGGLYMGKKGWNDDIPYVTPEIDAKPFFRPGFENNLHEIQNKMADVIKKELGL